MTKYESEILDIINASNSHMTSEEVFFSLKETEPKVVLATVYNNLKKLVENEKIIKISLPGQPDRYDKTIRHDHLICKVCSGISDFKFSDLKNTLESELGQAIDGYELRIQYVCPKCKKDI